MSKMYCIYEDTEYIHKIKKELTEAKAMAKAALNEYKSLTGKTVEPNQFDSFLNNAIDLTIADFEQRQEIPKGYDRQAYLKLLKYPDVTRLQALISNVNYKEYLQLSETGEVEITKEAEQLLSKRNLYLNKQQNEIYKKITAFVDINNQIEKFLPQWYNVCNSGYNFLFQRSHYPNGELKYDIEALHRNIIKYVK